MGQDKGSDLDHLKDLGKRIAAAEKAEQGEGTTDAEAASRRKASRVGYDIIGALLGGLLLGWLVDREFGWSPWGVMAGLGLGFAAGVLNAWRSINGVDRAVGLRKRK